MQGYIYPNEYELHWGLLVAVYPYLTGLVAGAFILASLARVFNMKEVQPTYRLSLLAALAWLIAAPLPLLAHLGHPERAYEILITPNVNARHGDVRLRVRLVPDGGPGAGDLARLPEGPRDLVAQRDGSPGKPVSLADGRYKGKVVVVTIGGTWCPNCHDEAAFLVPYYAEKRSAGLEVVGVMFEYFPEPAQALAAVRRFQQKFGIDYPLLLAGSTEKEEIAAKLPMLERLYAYPTTLVIDRRGRVRQVHAGFSGPATGAAYEEWQREFTTLIDRLLAEQA